MEKTTLYSNAPMLAGAEGIDKAKELIIKIILHHYKLNPYSLSTGLHKLPRYK